MKARQLVVVVLAVLFAVLQAGVTPVSAATGDTRGPTVSVESAPRFYPGMQVDAYDVSGEGD